MVKMKMDKEALTGFFFLHIEKIILGAVLLLLGVFVYTGYSLESIRKTPDELASLAQSAEENVVRDTWPAVADEYQPPTGHVDRITNSQIPTQDNFYMATKPLMPSSRQQTEKRQDPELQPPMDLEVYAVSGPVAYRMRRDATDPLADLNNAEAEKIEKKQPRRRKKRRTPMYGYGSDMESSSDMMSDYMEGESDMESDMMSGYGSGMDMDMGGMYGAGAMAGGVSAASKKFPGFRAAMGALAKPRDVVAVKALVPWQDHWDEYERAFSTAQGYNPQRDVPRYLSYTAQRADVTDKPDEEPQESDWVTVSHTNQVRMQMLKDPWLPVPELVDPRYVSPVLTMPVPPLMQRELDPLALHAETPRRDMMALAQRPPRPDEKEGDETTEETGEEPAVSDVPGDLPGAIPGMGGPGMGMPGMGMSGMSMGASGYGYGGSMESDYGYGSDMDSDYGYGSDMDSGYGYGYGGDMESDYGYGSDMDSDYGSMASGGYGYGGMSGMAAARGPRAEFLLVRFYDLSAKPGRKYRYRVQVLVEDPNHPQDPRMAPNERSLDEDVKTRLKEVEAREETDNRRYYFVRTEFSEPSDVISLDLNATALAGDVEAARSTSLPNFDGTMPTAEPTGELISVVWDSDYACDVPALVKVHRGSVLNFTKTAKVIHPVQLIYKEMPDYDFQTDHVVVDMLGGQELPSSDAIDEEPLKAPGEYILIDPRGRLFVRNELEDAEPFDRYAPPVVETTPGGTPGYEAYESDYGYSELEGPGGSSPRGRRGR
jgi:hypothetical protein